jgi:ABC-type transporter Mla subunit MlaD
MMPLVEDTTKQIRSTAREFEGVGQDTRQTIPEIRQTNDELKKLLRSANEVMPTLDRTLREAEGTARELSQLSKSAREMVPELRQTNDELKKLVKSANDTWPAVNRELAELESATRLFGKLAERANLLLQTNEEPFTKTLAALQKTFEGTASLLNDKNVRMVEEMLREMRVASRRLDPVLANVDELANESRAAVRQANKAFATLDDTLRDIKRMTGNFSETAPGMVKNFNESSVLLNATLRDVRGLIQAVGRNDGTVQRLLSDPGLYNNLNDAAIMVTRILPRVDRALKDVETFADKIARHPESLGIGGAIRPSSGLKESPTFGHYGPR